MSNYLYSANANPHDGFTQVTLLRDDNSVVVLERGKIYSLSASEFARLRGFVVLTPSGGSPSTPNVVEGHLFYGTFQNGDVPSWDASVGAFVPLSSAQSGSLDDLTDVDATGGSTGDVLTQQSNGTFALETPTGGSGSQFVIDVTQPPYNAQFDNSTDDTAAVQAALDAAVIAVPGMSPGNDYAGTIVQLPPGRGHVSTLNVPANVQLRGHGPSATYLYSSGTTAGTAVVTVSGDQQVLSDFGVIVNDQTVDGINLSNSGGASILSDARTVIRDVIVIGGRDGFRSNGENNELRLSRCSSYRAARYGFGFSSTDGFMEGCTAAATGYGSNALYTGNDIWGFLINSRNWRIYGCKAFGQLGSFGGGFFIGDRSQIACSEAQDCQHYGFALASNDGFVNGSALLADSCGKAGFSIFGAVSLSASQVLVRSGGLYTTQEAIVIGGPINGVGPKISDFVAYGCDRLYYPTGNNFTGSKLDLQNRFGTVSVAYAATITPDPWAGQEVIVGSLTGNVTIANPATSPDGAGTPYPVGMEIIVQLAQDAAGSRAVTFGTAYKTSSAISTAASSVTRIRFTYDGTYWRETSRAVT
jgi:hypothetical protein